MTPRKASSTVTAPDMGTPSSLEPTKRLLLRGSRRLHDPPMSAEPDAMRPTREESETVLGLSIPGCECKRRCLLTFRFGSLVSSHG